jgi:hypothetical protein
MRQIRRALDLQHPFVAHVAGKMRRVVRNLEQKAAEREERIYAY